MFSSIRSSRRSATPIARLSAALPELPHSRNSNRWHVPEAATPIVRAGLVAVPIGATAVIFRDKLASMVSGSNGEEPARDGDEQAPDAGKE
jgi:hypothetical protein